LLSDDDPAFLDGHLSNRLYDDIHEGLFGPLIERFGLDLYQNLRIEGIRGFLDFQAVPIAVITPNRVLVATEIWQADYSSTVEQSIIRCDIALDKTYIPQFPPAGKSLAETRQTGLFFDVHDTFEAWNQVRSDFFKGIPQLRGIPNPDELLRLADMNKIPVEEVELKELGLTNIDMSGDGVLPKIRIKKTLPRGVKMFTLAHELGHIVLHLPILVAQAIEKRVEDEGEAVNLPLLLKLTRLDDLIRECPSIEDEADWFAGFLLFPPMIVQYLEHKAAPTPKKTSAFKRVLPTRSGGVIGNVREFEIWCAVRRLLTGEEFVNWAGFFDYTDRYTSARRDEFGRMVGYGGDYDSIASLVVRLTDVVARRPQRSPKPSEGLRCEVDVLARRWLSWEWSHMYHDY
jgi:IrrE N-terminal-like domain